MTSVHSTYIVHTHLYNVLYIHIYAVWVLCTYTPTISIDIYLFRRVHICICFITEYFVEYPPKGITFLE